MKCLTCGSSRIEVPTPPEPNTYAMVSHPEGDATNLHRPWCRDCGSNDIKDGPAQRKCTEPKT
jgi:hypothetical protein